MPGEGRRAGRAGVRAPIVAKKWRNGHGAKGAQEGGDVTEQTKQLPDAVPAKGASPAGEIRARWAWVEAEVWTERMLTALEQGVLGGKWFSLMDKVYALRNLRRAFERVKANERSSGRRSRHGRGVRATPGSQPGKALAIAAGRQLSSAGDSAGVDSQAGQQGKAPAWGFRRYATGWCKPRSAQCWSRSSSGTSQRTATGSDRSGAARTRLRRVDALLTAGYTWVVDADLKSYFDTIPHAALLDRVREKVADSQVLGRLEAFLTAKVMETAEGWTPEEGTPQGRGHQSAAVQYLSRPPRPSDGRGRISRW